MATTDHPGVQLKFKPDSTGRILECVSQKLPSGFGESVNHLQLVQARDGHWYWHARGELYASMYQKCGRFSSGTEDEVRAKAEALDWTLTFLYATCITTYSIEIPVEA